MAQFIGFNNIHSIIHTRKFLACSIISLAIVFSISPEASAITAPNQPDNFSIIAVSDDQINLSWSAPFNGGSPITGYLITYVVDGGEFRELAAVSDTTTNYSHTNLLKDHIYFYQIYAINSFGKSIPTNFLSATTLQGNEVPGIPTLLQANTASPTSIFLYWNAPQDNGGSIVTGYQIEFSTITNQWKVLVPNTGIPQASFYHTGIDTGRNYNYRVSAINSNGVGNPSDVISIVPQATTSPTITSIVVTSTTVRLSWVAPSYTYGEQIIGYKIDTKMGDTYEATVENTGAVTNYTISGLTTDKPYTFRLAALFSGGTQSIPSIDVAVVPSKTSFSPTVTLNNLPNGASVYTAQQSPGLLRSVAFSEPGPQTQYFQSPDTDIDGIWANVSTFVTGAVLYFDSNDETYSMEIVPNSKTWISFNGSMNISNVRINIDDRLYSSDIGSIAYIDLDVVAPLPINNLPSGASVFTGQQSPGPLNTVAFTNPGPQSKNFQFPNAVSEVNGIWANVSTYVNGAVLYFDSNNKIYSLEILPNSNTWINFKDSMAISNIRISIIDRGFSSDIGSVAFVSPEVAPKSQSTPDAPQELRASLDSGDIAHLSWISPSNDGKYPVSGYRVEYKTSSDNNWSVLSRNIGLQTIFVQPGLADSTKYTFRVSAINIYGASVASNEASVTTANVVKPTPTNISITSGTLPVFNTETSVSYVVTGGKVFGVIVNKDATSLDFLLQGETAGVLYTQLPRSLIDAKQPDESDRSFYVTANDENAEFSEITTTDYRSMSISFPSGTDKISIVGTSVVPEFGTIAMMILVVSIMSIIVITGKTNLSMKSWN